MSTGPIARRLRTTALVALAASLTTALLGAASSPAVAAPSAPGNLLATTVPVLSWDQVSGATRYEVQVDNDSGFGSPELSLRTTNTRTVPTKALATGTQHWRVRALDQSGSASSWSQDTVVMPSTDAPSGLIPDGVQLHQPDEPPVLSWTGVPGASSYSVEMDTDDDFIGTKTYTTQTTSLVWPDPLEAGDYWWRVTASRGTNIVSFPSEPASFDILPLDPVVLTGPVDGPDTQIEDVILDWDPVPGAQSYELRVARDADFNTIIDSRVKVLGTRYSPPTTYNNAQYFWQVRALDMAGKPTAWTTVQNSFSRVWPQSPQAEWPLGDVNSPQVFTGEPYFQWTPVPHATKYQLQVGTDPNFSPLTYSECLTAGATYTVGNMNPTEACHFPAGQLAYWRVRALDLPYPGGVQGLYSDTQAVVWQDPFITEVSPSAGALVDIPVLRWSGVRDAESYTVAIFNPQGTQIQTKQTYSTTYVPVIGSKLTAGLYTWRVTAKTATNRVSLIHEGSFEASGNLPTTGADPLTPLTGIAGDAPTVRAPLLSWEPMTEAAYYKIQIGNAVTGTWYTHTSTDVINQALGYPAVVDTSKNFFTPGDYTWRADAFALNGSLLATGPIETFSIAGFPAVTGQSLAVAGTTLDAAGGCTAQLNPDGVSGAQCDNVPTSPVLSWDRVPGMSYYMVYVSHDSSFTNLVQGTVVPGTTGTRYALTNANTKSTYPDSQAGKSYYWFIRPCKTAGTCGPNPVSTTGMATNAFRKLSPQVQLLSPEHDADPAAPNVDTGEITFEWEDFFTTAQATTWSETGEAATESAQWYRIQVDDSQTFSSPLEDIKVDQPTYTSFAKLYPEGQLYWRVQAIDANNSGLAWSETRTLVKRSPAAVPTFPIADAAVSGTATFRWEPQPFNASYRLEVYKNNDTTFSAGNRVLYKDVTATGYSWDQPLPASNQAYVWRVRGKDSSGNWLPWSTTGRFFSTGASPSLLDPADASFQEANELLFTWTSVPGAVNYQVEIRTATSSWTNATTVATAYAPISAAPDGTLTWKVTALDARNHALGTSETRTFQVDGSAPNVIAKSPTSRPKRTVNFKATFSEPVKGVNGRSMKLFQKGRKAKLPASIKMNASRTKAILNPKYNLKPGKVYTVKLSSRIKDDFGNPLAFYSWKVATAK